MHEEPDLELLGPVAAIAPPRAEAVASDVIAGAKYEADVAAGRAAMRTTGPPYFGLDGPRWALERAGLIEIDPGIAAATLPGRPASTTQEVFVIVTPRRRRGAGRSSRRTVGPKIDRTLAA